MKRRASATIVILAALLFVTAAAVHAYSTFGGKWASFPVVVYLNPANRDVTTTAAITAIQSALNAWNTQSGSSFRYQYGGTVTDTATAHDYRNVVFFRNASNGGVIATTYSWWSGGQMLDSDVVFWDGGFKFYTGTSGCTGSPSAYIEDVATHELGHALGLGHSSANDATMYSTYMMCTQTKRTLASDDMTGAKALYPSTAAPPPNTPPTVVITSPANGATLVQGSTISLAATATDTQDGNISSRVQWTDNGATAGSGSLVSRLLSVVGVHTFVAKVTDNNGAPGSSQVSITVTVLQQQQPPPPSGTAGTLTTKQAVSADGWQKTYLYWTGLTGTYVDVYRNNAKINTTPNDGYWGDNLPTKTPGTYNYFICPAGTTNWTPARTL